MFQSNFDKLQFSIVRSLLSFVMIVGFGLPIAAQQLEPRAYSVLPTGVNIVNLNYSYSFGDVTFDPSLPVDHASAQINTPSIGYYRSLDVFGRPANVTVVVPYAAGNLQGNYLGSFLSIYRSGMTDSFARFAINLYGARAMKLKDFASYRQRTNIGVSVVVSAPTGQYDPAKTVNLGANRWAVKPEIGLSHRLKGRFILDAYLGVWLYSDNNDFLHVVRSQEPILSTQFHVSYDIKPRLWVAFDANFFRGGRTSINGNPNNDVQKDSRVGGTISVPLTRRQSLKFAYAVGAYTTIGGDFQTFSFGYQYFWGGGL